MHSSKQVRLVLDERTHATGALASPAMASLQGAALLCYNDAQFSEVCVWVAQRIERHVCVYVLIVFLPLANNRIKH